MTVGGASGTAVILPATSPRSFGPPLRLATPVRFPHVVVTGDFNGDGMADFAVWGRDTVPPRFGVLESQGEGRFSEPLSPSPPLPDPGPLVPVLGAAAGNFDSDGADELIVLSETASTTFAVWRTASGEYASGAAGPMLGVPASLQAADMDADGMLDAVVLVGASLGGVSLLRGLGEKVPAFEESCVVFPQSGSSLLLTQDFNRDYALLNLSAAA